MAKNLIPEIAQMLGVELGEEFQIKDFDGLTYKFNLDGLSATCDNRTYISAANALAALVSGKLEITKLPWKPKKDQLYWTFDLDTAENKLRVLQDMWMNRIEDATLLKAGWVYHTRTEAEAALPDVAKELGVKYKL